MNCVMCETELMGQQRKYCCKNCKNRDSNNKLQNYLTQSTRAAKFKAELVELAGGGCCRCGYNKNYAALHFHHINPNEKEFELDGRHLANGKRDRLLTEFEKCILLCANCHAEEHHPVKLEAGVGIEPTTSRL